MKRLWFPLLVILLLAGAALVNIHYLGVFATSLSESLESAQKEAENGHPDAAYRNTLLAQQRFLDHAFYLHVTLNHEDIDSIQASFGEVLEYLRLGETSGVYVAANSNLLIKLSLLTESEQLTLKNIL